MSQRFTRLMTSLALAALLAACNPGPVPDQLPFAEPGVELSVVPVGLGCAPDGSYRSTVSWEVPGATSSKIEIQVGSVEPEVFTRSNDPAGSEETGVWVSEGMLFVLRDRGSGMVLAALKAGPGNCDIEGLIGPGGGS